MNGWRKEYCKVAWKRYNYKEVSIELGFQTSVRARNVPRMSQQFFGRKDEGSVPWGFLSMSHDQISDLLHKRLNNV